MNDRLSRNGLLDRLLLKLKTGNARSIHLNALPGRTSRLDLYDLIHLDPSLHLKLLRQLLNGRAFRFPLQVRLAADDTTDDLDALQQVIRRLNALYYQQNDEWMEHGTQTFALGYPLLIHRDPEEPSRIIKAPVLLWYLSLEKDLHHSQQWTITRSDEHPVLFNEVLRSYLESRDQISLADLGVLPEDIPVDEAFVSRWCRQLLDRLGGEATAYDEELKVLPGTNREGIERLTRTAPWIRWSGIFGLYRSQKQPIIADIQRLRNDPAFATPPPVLIEDSHPDPCLATDPSQKEILRKTDEYGRVVIQGPPGTGKSRALTALVADALRTGETSLIVCEKKTALDIISRQLEELGLGELSVTIDDIYRDRKPIVDRMRSALDARNEPPLPYRLHELEDIQTERARLKRELETAVIALHTPMLGDDHLADLMVRTSRAAADRRRFGPPPDVPFPELPIDRPLLSEGRDKTERIAVQYGKLATPGPFDGLCDDWFSSGESPVSRFRNWYAAVHRLLELLDTYPGDQRRFLVSETRALRWRINTGWIYSARYRKYRSDRREFRSILQTVRSELRSSPPLPDGPCDTERTLDEHAIRRLSEWLEKACAAADQWPDQYVWRQFLMSEPAAWRKIFTTLARMFPPEGWPPAFTEWALRTLTDRSIETAGICSGIAEQMGRRDALDVRYRQLSAAAILSERTTYAQKVLQKRSLSEVRHLYNYRSNKRYGHRNSLRSMIAGDPELFLARFPVCLVNPTTCSSVLPLTGGLYDRVLFDEASQLRIEDTYPALLRGRKKIVSGDRHQMSPPSWFQTSGVGIDPDNREEEEKSAFLASSDSLLEYASDTGFVSAYLDFHYRSRHPDLIAFSNAAFYGHRLVPMPASISGPALRLTDTRGTYLRNRTNPIEARALIDRLFLEMSERETVPSVGIATFNLNQRDLIWDLLLETARKDETRTRILDRLLEAGLFVKNLEQIQGDERDVLFISTTFGPDADGKFRQNFGPVTRSGGYKLLNVLITRAREQIQVFTSIPGTYRSSYSEGLRERGVDGNAVFYAWLEFAAAVGGGARSTSERIRSEVARYCEEPYFRHETARLPVFHRVIRSALIDSFGETAVRHNLPFGGFLIDLAVMKDGQPAIALLSPLGSGARGSALDLFAFKRTMLMDFGLPVYLLDIVAWYNDPESELNKIRESVQMTLCK